MTLLAAAAWTLVLTPLMPQDPAAPNEERFVSDVRQLTFEGRRAGEGYFDRNGKQLVFQSEREPGNPWYQIYVLDLETGESERISPGMGKTTCSWLHPDGKRVLFASTHLDPQSVALQEEENAFRASGKERRYAWDYDEHFDLFAFDRTTQQTQRVTAERGYDAEGSYSPDGEWIAWSSNRHAYATELDPAERERLAKDPAYFLDLYLMRTDGSELRRLTEVAGYDGGPFFSPDGKAICFRRFSPDGTTAEIYTMDLKSGVEKKLTALGAMSWAPYFHPSMEYLIFTTNRHGFANFELYIVDAEGRGEPVRITATPGFDGLPCFTPDGKGLAWTTNRTADQSSQIFLAQWNHAAAREALRATFTQNSSTQTALLRAVDLWQRLELAPPADGDGYLLRCRESKNACGAMGRLIGTSKDDRRSVWIGARAADANASQNADEWILSAVATQLREWQRSGKFAHEFDLCFVLWDGVLDSIDPKTLTGGDHIATYIDLSELHGGEASSLVIGGAGTSLAWKGLIERANVPVGLPLTVEEPPATSGFCAAFAARSIPTLTIHSRADNVGALDDEQRARYARLIALLARGAASGKEPIAFTKYERPAPKAGTARPSLGTIPDYAPAPVPGLKLSGVVEKGPAARAGIEAGDIVVELNGRSVKNIEDYAAALDALEVGKPITMVVLRGNAKLAVEVIPARKEG